MNTEAAWALLRQVADTLEFGEDPVIDLPTTPAELDELRARLHPIGQAIRLLQVKALEAMQPHLGTKGFVRYGNRVYRAAPDNTIKVKPEAAGEFWELVAKTGYARRLFNPNDHRITGLRELAEGWVDQDTGEVGWAPFAERFLDVTEGEVKVTEMPADKAPKFIQAVPEGEVEHRK